MRISDWSSDVCSSDLVPANVQIAKALNPTLLPCFVGRSTRPSLFASATSEAFFRSPGKRKSLKTRRAETGAPVIPHPRSEEHTSELQSLMRISYAVFCLKKKKHKHNQPSQTPHQ